MTTEIKTNSNHSSGNMAIYQVKYLKHGAHEIREVWQIYVAGKDYTQATRDILIWVLNLKYSIWCKLVWIVKKSNNV